MGTYTIGVKPGQAGSKVTIETPTGTGNPSPFGVVAYLGAFRWGPLDVPVKHLIGGEDHYHAVRGEPLEGDFTAVAVDHGFALAGSALRPITHRVADGNEREAAAVAVARLVHASLRDAAPGGEGDPWRVAFRVLGAYPGRKGGARLRFGAASTLPTSGSVFNTGIAAADWPFGKDELAGSMLYFAGITTGWTIVGNDAAGQITVAGDFAAGSTNTGWWIERENVGPFGTVEHVGLRIEEDPILSHAFRLVSLVNGGDVSSYDRVVNGSDQDRYFGSLLSDRRSRLQELAIQIAGDNFPAGADPTDERYKPAAWCGIVTAVTATKATILPWGWWREDGGSASIVPTSMVLPDAAVPCRIALTDLGGALFDVEVTTLDGERVLVPTGMIQATGGATLNLTARWPWLPAFDVALGSGDLVVFVNPVPTDLAQRKGYLHVNALSSQGNIRLRYRVRSSTPNSITVLMAPGDVLSDHLTATGYAKKVSTGDGPYSVDAGDALTFTTDGGTEYTLTWTDEVGTYTAQAVADAFTALLAAQLDEGAIPPLTFYVDSETGRFAIRTTTAMGPDAQFTIGAAVGGSQGQLGLPVVETTFNGTAGSVVTLEHNLQCEGGFDGLGALGDGGEYETALDTESSPFRLLDRDQLGLVKLCTPGVTDAEVIAAGMAFADAVGWRYVPNLPANVTTVDAAVAWFTGSLVIGDNARSLANAYFPGWFTPKRNPFGKNADVLCPVIGPALGYAAGLAEQKKGYHEVAAGEKADLSKVVKSLPTDLPGRGQWLDDAPLNQVGLVAIQHDGPRVMLWGARSPEIGGQDTIWSHKWDVLLHIAAELRILSRKYAFSVIPDVWPEIRLFAKNILRPHWLAGAFNGPSFEESILVEIGTSNNPPEVQDAGKVICRISLPYGIKNVAEQVEFVIATAGVAVVHL